MIRYEYKMVPAPTRGVKASGVKTPEARFAYAVETAINALAAEGWEYVRADTLPHEERQGLTGSATTFRTLLTFRRDAGAVALDAPRQQSAEPEGDTAPRVAAAAPQPLVPHEGLGRQTQEDVIVPPEIYAARLRNEDDTPTRS